MNITVKNAERHNIRALKNIWKDCFNDNDEYIDMFFDKGFIPENTLIAMYEFKPIGVIYMLPTIMKYKDKEYLGLYLYALGVLKEYRNNGVMTNLFNAVEEYSKMQGLSFLTIVPQDKSTQKFYEKQNFKLCFYNGYKNYMPLAVANSSNIVMKNCEKETFLKLREKYLNEKSIYVDLLNPYDEYRFTEMEFLSNDCISIQFNNKNYYFVGMKHNNIYIIKETSIDSNMLKILSSAIALKFDVDIVCVRGVNGVVDEIKPYGMYKSLDNNIDFNTLKVNHAYMNLMLN